ncbi:hypothetical protein CAPTEDRAFT_204392 [Capitella teleta]|uniref:KY-like immunoglobulin-like domain-containing protein n=1 Tax=Capitella teleta TaxID=283909 RepID=R7TVZ3_CAPTE|nr:hypothetical protein CAPTEDRAFT_204392 [Capitella teleta]|eukprot:ELT97869.1 hypothetical protein CAPTEDRAFT_204392 [Capitella teleta]
MGCGTSNPTVTPSREESQSRSHKETRAKSKSDRRNESPKRKHFGAFPIPQLLRDANREYAIETKRKNLGRNDFGELNPFPTATPKGDIFQEINYTKLDARATDKKATLDYLDGPLEDLVKYLCKPAKKDIERARVLFLWLAALDLSCLDTVDPPEGLAKLEVREIRGLVRGSDWDPGEEVANDSMGSWVAVVINKSWRLCDPHWASRGKNENKGLWDLIDDNGQGSRALPDEGKSLRYNYEDFYFLTDPEEFIYTHFPLDEKWQLLARPVTRREFNQLACLKPAFFKRGLQIKSYRKCTMKAPNGEVDIKIEMPNSKRRFMHRLWMWSQDRHQQTLGDLALNRFVFRKLKGNEMHVHLRFPATGKYKFDLFVRDGNESGTQHQIACTYVIQSEAAKEGIQPLPVNDRKEWGPGLDLIEVGLKPTSHEDAVIEAEYGVARLTFKTDKELDLMHSLHSNDLSKEDLENFVVHHQDGDNVIVDVKLPTAGEYALNLYAKEAGKDGKLANVCSYLLTTDQGAFDSQPFPDVPNGFAGVTTAGRDSGVKCISHKTAFIEAPESGELDIDLKIPKKFQVMGKLCYQVGKKARQMDNFMMTTVDQNDKARFSMRLPEAGFYCLKVFGALKDKSIDNLQNVYNFLIKVPTPKKDCLAFPKTFPSFRDNKCRIEAPLTGTLPANESIPFAVKVPDALSVATISGKGWNQLIKCEDGMWRGEAETGDPGSEVTVAARMDNTSDNYTTLLSYGVEQAKEIVKKTEVQQTKHKQAKEKVVEENAKKQEREDDIQHTHKCLLESIKACNTADIRHWLRYIEEKRFVSHMKDDVGLAKELLRSLDRIAKLQKALLNLDSALIAEIRGYAKPPKLVHEVMVASFLLLGDHEGKTREWKQCQKLCGTIGPQGLLRRVKEFDVHRLHPEIAAQANMLISQYRLDDVREKSAGAATFYSWTMGMTEELKMLKPGRASPAGISRQKTIFNQAKFKKKSSDKEKKSTSKHN